MSNGVLLPRPNCSIRKPWIMFRNAPKRQSYANSPLRQSGTEGTTNQAGQAAIESVSR